MVNIDKKGNVIEEENVMMQISMPKNDYDRLRARKGTKKKWAEFLMELLNSDHHN